MPVEWSGLTPELLLAGPAHSSTPDLFCSQNSSLPRGSLPVQVANRGGTCRRSLILHPSLAVLRKMNELSVQIKPVLQFSDADLEGFDKLMTGAKAGDTKTAKVVVSSEAESPASAPGCEPCTWPKSWPRSKIDDRVPAGRQAGVT